MREVLECVCTVTKHALQLDGRHTASLHHTHVVDRLPHAFGQQSLRPAMLCAYPHEMVS
jgi:hypothetical protein